MAQRVEVDTNLKFTADANQADKAINMIINDFKKLDETTAYLNKHSDSFSDKQILSMRGAYEQLASTITKLYETGYISEKQQAELGDAFVKSWGNFYSTLYNCGRSLDSIMSKAESGPANVNIEISKTNKELGLTEERLEHIRQRARELHEEYAKGDISRADFSESISKLAGESNIENSSEQIDEVGDSLNKLNSNADETNKILDILSSKFGVSKGELTQLGEAIGLSGGELAAFAAVAALTIAAIKKLSDTIDEMIDDFLKIGSAIGKGTLSGLDWLVDSLGNLGRLLSETAVSGIEAFVDALGSMMGSVEDAITLLDKLSDAGIEIERAFLTTSAYIGKDATDNVYNFINSISDASNTMFQSINDVVAATGSMGLASDQLVEATENMTIMGRNLGVLIGDTKKAFQDLGQTISKGYVGRNSILYRIFTKQEIDQVRKLSNEVDRYNFILERAGRVQELYNAYIQTASGKVSLLRMQYQELMTNIGTVALNLYAIVAPVLTKILTIANQLLSVLMSIFGWKPDSVGFSSIASDIGESLDKVGGSAQKTSKQLAKFDDVIQINDNKSGGGVGGIDPQALGDFSGLLDDALEKSDEFVNLWEHFKELMEAGDFFGAGEEFMKVISKLLTDIPWEDIKKKAGDLGEAIAKFLNGMFNVDNKDIIKAWQNVGKTIAEALNTVIRFLDKFLTELNFENIGKSLGYAWTSLWETLDIEGAGHTLYEAITGVFQFALGFLSTGGLSKAATALAGIWKSLFSNFTDQDLSDIANALKGSVSDILKALGIAVDALTDSDVQTVVFRLLNKIIDAFKESSSDWGKELGGILNNIIDFITNFFSGVDFGDIGEGFGRAWKALWETIDAQNVADGIYYAIHDAFDLVAGWLKGGGLTTAAEKIAEIIRDFFGNFDEQNLIDMTEVAVNIINDLINALGTIAQALTSDEVKNVVMGLITKLVEAFKENGEEWGAKINDIISSILDFIIQALDTADSAGIMDAIGKFIDSLDLYSLLVKYINIKVRLWWDGVKIWFKTHIEPALKYVGTFILLIVTTIVGTVLAALGSLLAGLWRIGTELGQGIRSILEGIVNFIFSMLDKIIAGIQTWWEWFSGNIKTAFAWITDTLLPNLWNDISTWASSIWSDIQEWPNRIYELFVSIGDIIVKTVLGFIEDVENIFNDFWGFIERIFSPETWAEAGRAAIDGIWNAIKSVWNNTIGNISLDIPGIGDWGGIHIAVPKLATGAIVTGPTNALIGEAGPEAVLPLKNNTQWMDTLAAKINNKTGNGGTIRVELADKPFYTRAEMYEFGALVVDSLKAYGLNIAMI